MRLIPGGQTEFNWWETHPEHGFDWNAYRKIEERLIKSGKLKELDVLHRVVDEDELVRAKDARFLKQNPFSTPPAPGSDSEIFEDSINKIVQDPELNKFARQVRKNYLARDPLRISKPWYREAGITRNDDWPKLSQQAKEAHARYVVERARGGSGHIWPDQFEQKFGLRPGEVYFEGAPGVPRTMGPHNDIEFTPGYRSDNPRNILKDPAFSGRGPSPWQRLKGPAGTAGLGLLMGLFDKQSQMAEMGMGDDFNPKYAEPGVTWSRDRGISNPYAAVRK